MWKAPHTSAARPSSTSADGSRPRATSSAPYSIARPGTTSIVGLVVLADVRGVGARDGALLPHPCHGDRGVQAAGERDAYPLADGELGQDLAHVVVLRVGWSRSRWPSRQIEESWASDGLAAGIAADHQDGVVAGDGAEHAWELGVVDGRGQELRRAGRGAQDDEVAGGLGGDQQLAHSRARRPRRLVGLGDGCGVRSPPSPGTAYTRLPSAARIRTARELDEVAREGGLGDGHAPSDSSVGELAPASGSVRGQQGGDRRLPGALRHRDARSRHDARPAPAARR